MPIYRGPGGSSPLNDNVTVSTVTELTNRAENAAEAAEGSATVAFQNAAATSQAKNDANQSKIFAESAKNAAFTALGRVVEAEAVVTEATDTVVSNAEAAESAAAAARVSELAADQAREDADQSSVVAQSHATTATLKAQEALESAQSAADSAQSSITSRIIASGQANNALNSANAAAQSATEAATSASEASNSAAQAAEAAAQAAADTENLARTDQQNNFTEKQVFELIPQTGLIFEGIDNEAAILASDLSNGGNRGIRYVTRDFGQHRFLVSGNARMTISSGGVTAFNNFSVRQDTFLEGELTTQGNVSVGSEASPADLTVAGGVVASTLKIEEESDTAGATRLVRFAKSRASVGYANNGLTLSTLDSSKDIKCIIGSNEIMRIDGGNGGRVGIGTQTPASKLHVSGDLTVDGNIVNDSLVQIETGTWTPVFVANDRVEIGSGTIQRDGEYVKIGNQVTVYFRYLATSPTAASRAIDRLIGLPFPIKNSVDNLATGSTHTINVQFTEGNPSLLVVNNSSDAFFRYNRNNTSDAKPAAPSNGASFAIRGSLTYQTI